MNNNYNDGYLSAKNYEMANSNNYIYVNNTLNLNKGKKVEVYYSTNNHSNQENNIFRGIIEEIGNDHLILSDPTTGNWYLLLIKHVDFIKFEENINSIEKIYPPA